MYSNFIIIQKNFNSECEAWLIKLKRYSPQFAILFLEILFRDCTYNVICICENFSMVTFIGSNGFSYRWNCRLRERNLAGVVAEWWIMDTSSVIIGMCICLALSINVKNYARPR